MLSTEVINSLKSGSGTFFKLVNLYCKIWWKYKKWEC